MQVLLVEDDVDLANAIGKALRANNIDVQVVNRGATALASDLDAIDLIVLDIGLPDMDGLEVCKKVKAKGNTPIIFLSAHTDESELLAGFDCGADDFVKKPFSVRELIARIHAVVNRVDPTKDTKAIVVGDLEIDIRRHRVVYSGDEIELTRKEFDILELLASHPYQLLTRDRILDSVWGVDRFGPMKTLDVHMASLRKKLPLTNALETVRGLGYRFIPEEISGFQSPS